jgi:ATP-binding cassette subfamily B protein
MESLRRQMGIVLQDPFIFSGTIRGNIAFGKPGATDDEIEEVARAVGVHDLIMRMEKGYDTPVLPNGANLSLGQRQLISFARVMLPQPKILMLDEATAGIDTQTEALLQRGVARLMEGRTTLIIAHRLSTVRDADRIVVIEHGRVAEQGSHEQLMRRGGLYANLYTMGFRDVSADGRRTNGAKAAVAADTSAAQ